MHIYEKFRDIWKDKPDKTTPVTAEALMHIEQGIYDNSVNIINLENKITGGYNVIDVTFNNVRINTRSVKGLYYGTIANFASIGVPGSSVVSLTIIGFEDAEALLGVNISSNAANINAYSDISQTINSLTIRVSYIDITSTTLIAESLFSSISINTPTGNGLYYASLTTLEDMGVPEDATVIGILTAGWDYLSSSFQLTLSEDEREILIISNNIQSGATVRVKVAYFIP